MKKLYILVSAFMLSMGVYAQAPEKMSYQAVVRDASQNLITNQAVGMQITILQGSASGTVIYQETQTPTTNVNGLTTLEIGTGNVVVGNFSAIDWSIGLYFIKTETDPTGGMNYTIAGTSQMLSVPYALYAKSSGNGAGPQGPAGATGPQGPQGLQGLQGQAGTDGVDGIDGTNGLDGATGPQGLQGPAGLNGANGVDGLDGATGPMGPQGLQGPAGLNGANGVDGLDGATGPMGPQGLQGLVGLNGTNGVDGAVGANGADGVDGLDGATGPMGPQGLQGPAGIDGLDGATGPQGLQGPAGLNGANGVDGLDGATGPMGPQGLQGPAGIDGLDGATGPQGLQGSAGNDGLDGATGPMGPQGSAGIDGLDGATGPMGAQGPTGPAGFVSLNGATGTTQTYAAGTSGSDFNISTASNVHTFNIPNAGAAARGVVSTGAQTMAGAKTFTGNLAATSNMVVGNSTVTTGAALDVNSTVGTFLAPRMTTAQRDALVSVPDGSMIINTTAKKAQIAFTNAAANLNQSTWGSPSSHNLIASGQTMGQTFTAVYSASVTKIEFYATYRNGLTGTITSCKVYNGFGGALLATSPSTSTLDNGNTTHLFTFSGLNLVASQSYYVEFTMTYSGGALYTYYGTSYAGGTAYFNNVINANDLPFQIFHPASVTTWENLH